MENEIAENRSKKDTSDLSLSIWKNVDINGYDK